MVTLLNILILIACRFISICSLHSRLQIFSFLICFISFTCLIALASSSSIMLSTVGEWTSFCCCCCSQTRGRCSVFHHEVSWRYKLYRRLPFTPGLLRIFKWIVITFYHMLSSASIEMIVYFFPLVYYCGGYLQILFQLYISGINPMWSWCIAYMSLGLVHKLFV